MAGRRATFPQQTSLLTHPWVIGGLLLIVLGVCGKIHRALCDWLNPAQAATQHQGRRDSATKWRISSCCRRLAR